MTGFLFYNIAGSSDKKRIVVNAQNLQYLKNAIANKRIQIKPAPAATSPQSIRLAAQPYPVNLISVHPGNDIATPTKVQPLAAAPVKRQPSTTTASGQKLTPIRLKPLSPNGKPVVITPTIKTGGPSVSSAHQKYLSSPQATNPTSRTPTSAASGVMILPNKTVQKPQTKNSTNPHHTQLAAKKMSDLNLDINFDNPRAVTLTQVNQRVIAVSRVVKALRDELTKQKNENRFLRHQNSRIIESNQKLISMMALKRRAATPKVGTDGPAKTFVMVDKRSLTKAAAPAQTNVIVP